MAIKAESAFRTISEVAQETGVAAHILRYWETRFPQLRPLQRAGNRRYYRPDDVALVKRIDTLLNKQGYTVKGVQKLLADGDEIGAPPLPTPPVTEAGPASPTPTLIDELHAIRALLIEALAVDEAGEPSA